MSDGFSLRTYREMATALKEDGYTFRTFHDFDPEARHAVMRHDIDMDLTTALPMARLEADLGIPGIYFVLTRSELYSPASTAGRGALRGLHDAGHEIGLHFDVSLYPQASTDDLDDLCSAECDVLEQITGRAVTMVSFHRPAPGLIGLDRTIGGRKHAYQSQYVTGMTYRSDSRGRWNPLSPLQRNEGDPPAMQILTHPVWWNSLAEETVVERLERLLDAKRDLWRSELAANCRPYAEHLGIEDKARTEPFSGR